MCGRGEPQRVCKWSCTGLWPYSGHSVDCGGTWITWQNVSANPWTYYTTASVFPPFSRPIWPALPLPLPASSSPSPLSDCPRWYSSTPRRMWEDGRDASLFGKSWRLGKRLQKSSCGLKKLSIKNRSKNLHTFSLNFCWKFSFDKRIIYSSKAFCCISCSFSEFEVRFVDVVITEAECCWLIGSVESLLCAPM